MDTSDQKDFVLRQAQDEVTAGGAGVMRLPAAEHGLDGEGVYSAADAAARRVVRRTDASRPAHHEARWRKFSPEVWARVEEEYLVRGEPGAVVAERHGMALQTLYSHFPGKGKRARAAVLRRAQDEDVRAPTPTPPLAESDLPLSWGGKEGVRGFLIFLAWFCIEVARKIVGLLSSDVGTLTKKGRVRVRRQHSKEIWAQARRDYEEGSFTAPEIAERYGMSHAAVKKRAGNEGWCKTQTEAPSPLLKEDDPAQVDGSGASVWADIAHEAQIPPLCTADGGAWRTWLFQGGRGAGKTRAGAEWLAARAEASPHGRFALIAATEHDAREVMIEGPSGLRSLPGREHPRYDVSRRRLRWKNGAVAYVFSAQEPERLRGPQFMAAWADEFCTWPRQEHTLAMIRLGLRLGKDPQLVVTTTPKPLAALRKLRGETSCVVTEAGTAANAANLSESFVADLVALYGGTRIEKQEMEGLLLDAEGALWRLSDISRCEAPGRFERVVVGVDPPAGAGVCGIVVAGRAGDRAYVLEDASCGGMSALGWAERVAEMAVKWRAAKVIAEGNQGGDMVKQTLRTGGVACPIELTHAGAAKVVRAQPVAALYEKGRVMHCGAFAMLEEEMLALGSERTGGSGEGKCDRADALVWAMDDLLVRPRVKPGIMRL